MTNRVSIAMCTYNGARYLEEQLASIAAQTRLPDELVVCDDNSADATREIINRFAASAPFPVHIHLNEQTVGSTKNFERAITLCEGDVIALSDQDDVWLPEKLQRIEDCFLQNPKVGLVFTDADVVDEDLQPLGYCLWQSVGFDNSHREFVRTGRALDVLFPGWTVTGATMAFRGTFKNLVLEIPTNLTLIHDGWIALMIASVADVSFIEEPLIKYRQHPRQQVGAKERKADNAEITGFGRFKTAIRRTNSYQEMIEIGTQAQDRLLEHLADYESADAFATLGSRLTHLRMRAALPNHTLPRFTRVITELLAGRYHQYSCGLFSAAKDLLNKSRENSTS